jgi:hypothetical protein
VLGVGFALWWALLVTYILWRVDKKDEDDVYDEYRKVLDALKKEEQEK